MSADRKTVRFVTNVLHIKRQRRGKRQSKAFPARLMIKLFAGISFRPLGNCNYRDSRQIKILQTFVHGMKLPQPAVQQNHVGAVFGRHLGKTAPQHFAHHRKIVVGNLRIFNIESSVGFLVKTLRSRHDHCPDRITALDMRVIINFDPFRHFRQIENPLHFRKIVADRIFERHFAFQRFFGIIFDVGGNFCFVSALIPVYFGTDRFAQKFPGFNIIGNHNFCRRNVRSIETAQKGFHNFALARFFRLLRKERQIAAILPRPDKKDLNAYPSVGTIQGNKICRLYRRVLNIAALLHAGEGADAVTINHRGFKILTGACFFHFGRHLVTQPVAFVFDKRHRFIDQPPIVFFGYFADTRRRTTFDLIHQTGTVAVAKHAVRTRTQQKGPLQQIEHVIDRAGIGKRPEIFISFFFNAAIFAQHRIFGFDVQRQIRKSFVVFEQNVVMRLKFFN